MRKLLVLALGGAAAAYVIKSRQQSAPASADSGYAPGPASAAEAPPVEEVQPTAADEHAEEVAEAEATPEEAAVGEDLGTADTVESPAVVPDTSDEDSTVRREENAAAAEAAQIGGDADTVTADLPPETRPMVEGSGDDEETFEQTEDQGR